MERADIRQYCWVLVVCFLSSGVSLWAGPLDGVAFEPQREAFWQKFDLDGAYIYQNQNYEITSLDADLNIPPIVAPKIKVSTADVDHLIPRELPAFIRGPLLAQARDAAQKQVDEQIEEEVRKARAMIPTLDESSVVGLENTSHIASAKLGYSPFQFLNLFVTGGRIDGEVDVTLVDPFGKYTLGYEGWTYGVGGTLKVGTDRLFASLTSSYNLADLGDGGSEMKTTIFSPKTGIHGDRGALWVGAQYQKTRHTQSGTLQIEPLGPVDFEVELRDETNWNWLVGGRLNLRERAYLMVEGGFGDRTQALVSLGVEF